MHTLDFALPLPLLEASRLATIGEVVLYSVLFSRLIYGVPFVRWGWLHILGATSSTLVNLHTFPLMAWHTIDGLFFVAIGLGLLYVPSRRQHLSSLLGMLCLGTAALMKQSFLPAPLLGLVRVFSISKDKGLSAKLRWVVLYGLVAALPLASYVGAVAAAGGFGEMMKQLLSAEPVFGQALVTSFHQRPELLSLVLLVASLTVLLFGAVAFELAKRGDTVVRSTTVSGQPLTLAGLALQVVLSLALVAIPLRDGLALAGSWGLILMWALIVFLLLMSLLQGRVDEIGLALLLTSWLSMLSWGYQVPDLVAGSVVLFLVHRTWQLIPRSIKDSRLLRSVPAVAASLTMAVVGSVFVTARETSVYRDLPKISLTTSLSGVSEEFGNIRTNPVTAEYISQAASCVEETPARSVAIVPDNAALYPALGLRNPFPIDWLFPLELSGSEGRLLRSAKALSQQGDYLVLFRRHLPPSSRHILTFPMPALRAVSSSMGSKQISEYLQGDLKTCGSFLALHAPPLPR